MLLYKLNPFLSQTARDIIQSLHEDGDYWEYNRRWFRLTNSMNKIEIEFHGPLHFHLYRFRIGMDDASTFLNVYDIFFIKMAARKLANKKRRCKGITKCSDTGSSSLSIKTRSKNPEDFI